MLISMTGYGQAEVANQTARVSVEIRTVNHRFLDISIKTPKGLANREQEIKEAIRSKFSRGRVTINISAETTEPDSKVKVNTQLMEEYLALLRDFADKHGLSPNVDMHTLAMLPDVFVKEENESGSEELWLVVKEELDQAIDACRKMRLEEGKALEADLRGRLGEMRTITGKIEKLAPAVIKQRTETFRERLSKIMGGAEVDNDRWMTEIAILADKLDFTEEITRLKSHTAQFKKCLDEGGAVSKRLTYLLQEIHREATTISSKASDAGIVSLVVNLKEETEKLREQVQNIE
ncbi:MAG: YicC family protein [Candidatus Latescibacteria bacterium]|nr:YicC family protein [Candidatus Latescibacterota bacterium]NIM22579.1 YicC family protein [Candidatus Latescibacterota bacterium]NIM64868.1 YicC family protein [Candidatus Latescibacterota bacterium]NIO01383.1 YicC family protein [Candidatus Latescibacterota bacterium]NIO27893.1 YicC family protein [Candidatus Latescibacterota bacterium]